MKLFLFLFLISSNAFCTPVEDLTKTVYELETSYARGTGFQMLAPSGDSVIVTNWHICNNSTTGWVHYRSEYYNKTGEAKILEQDPTHDLCVLTGSSKRQSLVIGDKIEYKDKIYSAGYPRSSLDHLRFIEGARDKMAVVSLDYPVLAPCPGGFYTTRRSGKLRTCRLELVVIDTNLEGEPGSSGSPVVDSSSKVVGVVNSTNNNHAAMIPLKYLKKILLGF